MRLTCLPVGDSAVSVRFAQVISPEVNQMVTNMMQSLEAQQIKGIKEFVPCYASLMIYYDPLQISFQKIVEIIQNQEQSAYANTERQRLITIPCLYGGEYGPDLEGVARYHGLTPQEVIDLHSSVIYRVYMLGFSPGFPYLGGLPERLVTPRLETPRAATPAGSIGIAGEQTGIYSLSTPGGWRIIGHTPVPLFAPDKQEQPFLLRAGDLIRFLPVTEQEYKEVSQLILKRGISSFISKCPNGNVLTS